MHRKTKNKTEKQFCPDLNWKGNYYWDNGVKAKQNEILPNNWSQQITVYLCWKKKENIQSSVNHELPQKNPQM